MGRSVRSTQEASLLLRFELLREIARQALDVVAVGLGAGQGDDPTLGALDRVHRDQQVVATRAYVLELSLHEFAVP